MRLVLVPSICQSSACVFFVFSLRERCIFVGLIDGLLQPLPDFLNPKAVVSLISSEDIAPSFFLLFLLPSKKKVSFLLHAFSLCKNTHTLTHTHFELFFPLKLEEMFLVTVLQKVKSSEYKSIALICSYFTFQLCGFHCHHCNLIGFQFQPHQPPH